VTVTQRPEPSPDVVPDHFTAVAAPVTDDAWHITVRELPHVWTVAFSRAEIVGRARQRIARDLGISPADFHLTVVVQP
jgi:hypothetical protein